MLIRTATGIVFIVLVIGSVLLHQFAFAAVIGFFLVLSVNEWLALASKSDIQLNPPLMYAMSLLVFISFVIFKNSDIPLILITLVFLPLIAFVVLHTVKQHTLKSMAATVFGVIYLALPMGLLVLMHGLYGYRKEGFLIIAMFSMIWAYDTLAFVSGKLFGKHKLFERISPSKTWEGFIGGALLTFILTLLVNWLFLGIDIWIVAGAVLLIVIFSTVGDLFESALKRNAGVKDSGTLFPGHGGVLDRFDSVYFVVLPYFCYVFLTLKY